jgi:hypothetical protein
MSKTLGSLIGFVVALAGTAQATDGVRARLWELAAKTEPARIAEVQKFAKQHGFSN